MRIAAVDMGTNSFHLAVVEVGGAGALRTVAREKEMLRLGDDVAATGRIGEAAEARAVETLGRFADVARAHGAQEVQAYATAAIREAENGVEFVDRLAAATGVDVEVISGEREAQLIFKAVQASIDFDGARALAVDIGGGSVELMVGDQRHLEWGASLRLGVARLTKQFAHSDPLSEADRGALDAYVRAALEAAAAEAVRHGWNVVVGTSGTLLALGRIVAAARGEEPPSLHGYRVSRDDLDAALARLLGLDAPGRLDVDGLEARRADLMPAAAVLVGALCGLFDVGEMVLSTWALREGMLLAAVDHPVYANIDPARTRAHSVLALGRTHGFDELHGRQTARLAGTLFDALREELGVDPDRRELLGHAALVHDVGTRVSPRGHHKHGAYLVRYGELAGFEPEDRALLAALVRYHSRSGPKEDHPEYAALGEESRGVLLPLVALLRVADGLDRSRTANVLGLDVRPDPDAVRIRLTSTTADPSLDLWGGRRKAVLLSELLGRPVLFAE